jgi:hypothetical protein
MDLSTLENAVKAGWTGNDAINNLGMFGMGFNIATARLGTITRVWTTRPGDTEWVGLEINFDLLIQQRHFKTPMLTRPKIDPQEHGTEISIERLKPEQRQWFSRYANRSKLSKELGRAYSTMLRVNGHPVSFGLQLNGQGVRGRNHCVWGGEGNEPRQIQTARYGIVDAYQTVDVRLADRPFCTRCWQWLAANEQNCPACGSTESVVARHRHVRGWLGLQRYLSENDYGIDFTRHGRKIETANKDLFKWAADGGAEEEYPIDDPRHRGRIVGELHLDHCRVTYTKDRFDRNDPAWDEMVTIVRGQGPLRPDKAEGLGFGQNTSPLFLLFQAFRRSSPKPKVAGCYAKLLVVPDNERAAVMAQEFYASNSEYQTDRKWWELVEEADRQLLISPQTPTTPGGGPILPGFGEPGTPPPPQVSPPPVAPPAPPPPRRALQSLSREYRDDVTNMRSEIRAFGVEATDLALGNVAKPWVLKATPQGVHEFFVNTEHEIFHSATMTPLDGLLAELAWSAMDFSRGAAPTASFAEVLTNLREKYAGINKLDAVALASEASMTLTSIARSLPRNVGPEDSRALFNELTSAEQAIVRHQMATRSAPNPQGAISEGRFLEFAPRKTLLKFFEKHPELFFDSRYWDTPYSVLDYGDAAATEEARLQVVRYYSSLLTDALWLGEHDPNELSEASRARLLRAALALELLTANEETEDET